jgi:hypothetical protein
MSKDDNNPLRKLVNAEREASEIIAREERCTFRLPGPFR